jgi:hypothetical protein
MLVERYQPKRLPQPQFGRNELTDEPAGAAYLIDGGIAERSYNGQP